MTVILAILKFIGRLLLVLIVLLLLLMFYVLVLPIHYSAAGGRDREIHIRFEVSTAFRSVRAGITKEDGGPVTPCLSILWGLVTLLPKKASPPEPETETIEGEHSEAAVSGEDRETFAGEDDLSEGDDVASEVSHRDDDASNQDTAAEAQPEGNDTPKEDPDEDSAPEATTPEVDSPVENSDVTSETYHQEVDLPAEDTVSEAFPQEDNTSYEDTDEAPDEDTNTVSDDNSDETPDEESSEEESPEDLNAEEDSFCDKLEDTMDRACEIIDRYNDPRVKAAVMIMLSEVFRLIRGYLPKSFRADLVYSIGTPDGTGQTFAALSVIPMMVNDDVCIEPDFTSESPYVKGEVSLAGRIVIGRVLVMLVRILARKDCRYLIRLLLQEVKQHG